MKKNIRISIHCIFLFSLLILSYQKVQGQSCIVAKWGVDAGLYSGVMEHGGTLEPISPRTNDWFLGSAGLGVMDTSNKAALKSLLQAIGNPTYEVRLKTLVNSVVNNQIFIDGIFARDQFGGTGYEDATSYLTASKNGEDPAIWDPGQKNVLGKNDIIDAAGLMVRNGTTLANDLYFMGLFNMAEPGGTAYMDFEFYVKSLNYTPGSGFTTGGPQLGHTAYNFAADAANPGKFRISKVGDFIFSVSLLGQVANVETRLWVSYADWSTKTSSTFNWSGTFDGAFSGAPYGYAGITPLTANVVCGIVNPDGTSPVAPPWGTKGTKTNSWSTNYLANSLSEVAINLTTLGMDHSSLLGVDTCFFPLSSFMVKTRASASFTAQLKDFSGPYSFGFSDFNVTLSTQAMSCDSSTSVITAFPQRADVTYNWSTVDGSFIAGANPWQIIASKVGTYTLQVIYSTTCPEKTINTTIILDPTKPLFDGSPTSSSTTSCSGNNGTVTATASGATKPYTFSLYKDNVFVSSFTQTLVASSHTFTGLVAGNYRVDVKGVYACVVTTGTIIVPAKIPVVITPTLTHVTCNSFTTGKIELSVSGGKAPISYLWSTGNTTKDLLNIGAGTYTLTVTDSAGCVTTGSYTITQPAALSGSIVKANDTDPNLAVGNGTATLTVSGGTSPYSFSWVGPNSFTSTSQNITALKYGSYTVTITDANLCTTTATVFIYEPEICNDGVDNDGDGLNNCNDTDCKPAATSSITAGTPNICVGQTSTYSVTVNAAYDSYVWTVPASATINGSAIGNSISVTWNTTAGGQICVRGKKFDCVSDAVCSTINVAAVPIKPGTIIIVN